MNKRARKSEAGVDAGRPSGPVAVMDLPEKREPLPQDRVELEWLIDYRSRLLARLAHELRNPLTSILGFAEILLNYEKLTDTQADFCQKIQNSAFQIEDGLILLGDLARLEAGPSLSVEEFHLADALRETCAVLARQAQKQNASLAWRTDDNLPAIISDRSKLRQVLYNCIGYAISRSPDGARVSASAAKHGNDFVLTIEDEGEPLPGSSSMFATRETLSSNQSIATADLGLAIARQLVDILGAKLSFASREPRGLAVSLQIPARPPG